jgi:acyl-coenzyme A synthetase/AMP-(fatty) acid ligase
MNAADDLLAPNLTAPRGSRVYLRAAGRDYSYDEVSRAADAAGAGLRDAGLEPGDRVLLVTGDCFEFVATFWGGIKAGLVVVPVSQRVPASDVEFMLRDSGAAAVVCDGVSAAAVRAAAPDKTLLLTVGESWAQVCGGPDSLAAHPADPEEIALWLYTSGTTGRPKAVMHSHRSLAASPLGLAEHVLALDPDDIVFSSSRMTFTYGLINGVVVPVVAGASVVVDGSPAVFVRERLGAARPTIWCGLPSLFASLLEHGAPALPDSIRFIRSAGERLPAELFDRFRAAYGREIINGLGVTEALNVTCNRPGGVVPGSVGRAIPPGEVQARDERGRPSARGELWVRSPTTFSGYWGHADVGADMFDGAWMRTRDLVRIEDGVVFHEGRLGDAVKIGGEWVAPSEVEDVLRSHGGVHDAAVVVSQDGDGIATLTAFVAGEGADLAGELMRLCRSRLPQAKVPASIEIVDELPRSDAGKLQRFRLRR